MSPNTQEIHKGLSGVVADTTGISMVDPASNSLTYRGYPVEELAARRSFEEVAHLLWHDDLPTPAELAAQNEFCLLYTSPSPRDRTRSRMPSSA